MAQLVEYVAMPLHLYLSLYLFHVRDGRLEDKWHTWYSKSFCLYTVIYRSIYMPVGTAV